MPTPEPLPSDEPAGALALKESPLKELPLKEPSLTEHRQTESEDDQARPDASVLQDRLPAWFRTTWAFPVMVALLGVLFLLLSYQPLWHTDIWGHLAYGRYLVEHGLDVLYGSEPLMPLAEGVDFVDTHWLSQVIGYAMVRALGVTSLQFFYAASITACAALLTYRLWDRTGRLVFCGLGTAAFLWLDWQQLIIVRPQLAGLVCFVALLVLLTARRWHPANWVVVPLLFGLWANLHGSFIVGLGLLAAHAIGRAIDVFRRTRNVRSVFVSRPVQRLVFLTQLAFVATLLNPYGLRLYAEVLTFGENPNLQSLIEWDPLTLRMKQGRAVATVALLMIVLYRLSPRRVRSAEFLTLVGLGAAALWHSRMLNWLAPVMAYYLAIHAAAVWRRYRGVRRVDQPERRTASLWTIVGLVLAWIAFAPTHFALRVIHGQEPDAAEMRQILSAGTPIDAVAHLHKMADAGRLPSGIVFNTYEWGDYLLWAGPPKLKVFVASHVQYIPPTVWTHYMGVASGEAGFERTLDVYGVNLVLLDRARHASQIERLRRSGEWRLEFRSPRAAILVRNDPI